MLGLLAGKFLAAPLAWTLCLALAGGGLFLTWKLAGSAMENHALRKAASQSEANAQVYERAAVNMMRGLGTIRRMGDERRRRNEERRAAERLEREMEEAVASVSLETERVRREDRNIAATPRNSVETIESQEDRIARKRLERAEREARRRGERAWARARELALSLAAACVLESVVCEMAVEEQ